jgi:hypothetical protein
MACEFSCTELEFRFRQTLLIFLRPTLEKLFSQKLIVKTVTEYDYSQMNLASFLGLHCSTISRIVLPITDH